MKPVLIGINSEISAGTRGASLGLEAIKIVGLKGIDEGKDANWFFADHPVNLVPNENELLYERVQYPWARRIKGLIRTYERLSKKVCEAYQQGEDVFPLVIAGDHGTAAATMAGIKMAYPDKRLGIIWIDAHGDLHSPYTTPSGNMHGMPLALAMDEDNEENARRDLKKDFPETAALWEEIKAIGIPGPNIFPEDICMIGLRDTEIQEKRLIEKHKNQAYPGADSAEGGTHNVASEALEYLQHCDMIYISFDVDSLDKSISTGTGTPVIDGITESEARTLINFLLEDPKVRCLEIVEVNPLLDNKPNKMAEVAFDIIVSAVGKVKQRK